MEIRNLRNMKVPLDIKECEELMKSFTIFEKIEFSGITKEEIRYKLHDLKTRQVPERDCMIDLPDHEVYEYWFKNWLHPKLKHFFKRSPQDKRGCSQKTLIDDMKRDTICFYENGQHMFNYTIEDIEDYVNGTFNVDEEQHY